MEDQLKQWGTIKEKNTRLCLNVHTRLNAAMAVSGAKVHDYPSFLITCKLARQSCHMFCTSFIHCFHCWHFIRYNASIQLSLFFSPFYQHNWWALAIQNINPPSGSDSCADIWLQGMLSMSMCTQIWEMSSASSWGKKAKFTCAATWRVVDSASVVSC